MFLLLAIVIGVAFAHTVSRRRLDRTPEGFADNNGLVLDDESRRFIGFHLARVRYFRQLGALAGLAFGIVAALATRTNSVVLAFIAALVGSLVGLGVAEMTRWFGGANGRVRRVASLERRGSGTYLRRSGRRVEAIVAAIVVTCAVGALVRPSDRGGRPIIVAVFVAGALVLVCGRLLSARIARRALDVTNPRIREADEVLRVASVDAIGSIVASLVLCASVWLMAMTEWNSTVVVVNGVVVADVRGKSPIDTSFSADGKQLTVRWTRNSRPRSTIVDVPPASPRAGAPIIVGPKRLWVDTVVGFTGLMLVAWAIGEWLRVSKVGFGRKPRRGRRDVPAGVSA